MATLGNKKIPYPYLGQYGIRGMISLFLEMTIGAAGAISANDSAVAGLTVVKTAAKTGRYTFTLPSAYKKFLGLDVTLTGPSDVAWGATTVGGPTWFCRNNNIDRGTKAGTIDVQFAATGSNNDADLPSGTVAGVWIFVATGK